MKHSIIEYNWRTGNATDNFKIIRERNFTKTFSKIALKWFDTISINRYRKPRRILDDSIVGYHYEIGDLVIELH